MSEEDDLFSRWSRRKRKVAAETGPQDTPIPDAASDMPPPETPEEEAELLDRLGLPDPDTLKDGDDFAVFMQSHVPEFLRRRALRCLWKSNPVLANLDGLNDYDDDFNSPELTKKIVSTGYRVGKGFARRILEDQPQTSDDVETGRPDAPEDSVTEVAADAPRPAPDGSSADGPEAGEETFRPRRMRFDV